MPIWPNELGFYTISAKQLNKTRKGRIQKSVWRLPANIKEPEIVLNAIACHHEDVEPTSADSILVQAADAISGSRRCQKENARRLCQTIAKTGTVGSVHSWCCEIVCYSGWS